MTDKHTPGPWAWKPSGNFIVAPRKVVCENIAAEFPSGFLHHNEETEANARLICAAPDMLAVLQRLVTNGVDLQLYALARAAIDKATQE
jgi:hypothetical protein